MSDGPENVRHATSQPTTIIREPQWRTLVVLPITSGLLLWVSFWVPILVWIALAPLGLLICMHGDRRWLYFGAWLGGAAFFLPATYWLMYCDEDRGWLGWLSLAFYLSLYLPAFVFLARIAHRRWKTPIILAVPVVWTALEYVRMHALTGFGWLLLAHSVHRWTWLIQLADFASVWGVGFVVALANGLVIELLTLPLVEFTQRGRQLARPIKWRLIGVCMISLGTLGYSAFRLYTAEFRSGPLLLLVQSNLPQSLKNKDADATFDHILRLNDDARAFQADLVVWPETSFPYLYGNVAIDVDDAELHRLSMRGGTVNDQDGSSPEKLGAKLRSYLQSNCELLADVTNQLEKPLLVGLVRHDFRRDEARRFNSSVLFVPNKGPVAYYDKHHLVPFGEYLPLRTVFPLLKLLVPYDVDEGFGLDPSDEFRTIHHDPLHFASLICFEDTLPHVAREFFRRETPGRPIEFLVNQSNDGWFHGSIESDLHLAASVFRCVETRAPMARVSNIGITALVDGNGRIVKQFQRDGKSKRIAGGMDCIIPLDDRRGPYIAWGDWLAQLCLVATIGGLFASALRHLVRITRRRAMDGQTSSASG